MRFGLFTYVTGNIGDDIQSWATAPFLPKIDSLLFRDMLWDGKPNHHIAVIMNSWFMLGNENLGKIPAHGIVPVFHGFAIGPTRLLEQPWIDYYLKWQPIGCRDIWTRDELRKRGVDAYWSGCLTAMLKKPPDTREVQRKDIYIVDVDARLEERLIPPRIRERAVRRTHQIEPRVAWNPAARMKLVRGLMQDYQNAKLVITRRLHAALPCLAFGTPVLVLLDKSKRYVVPRWKGYERVIPVFGTDVNRIDIDWENPPVSQRPVEFEQAVKLIQRQISSVEKERPTERNIQEKIQHVPNGATITIQKKEFGLQAGQVQLQIGESIIDIPSVKWDAKSITVKLPDIGVASPINAQLQFRDVGGELFHSFAIQFPPHAGVAC